MTTRNLDEWIARYEKRGGNLKFEMSRGEEMIFSPNHGFFTYVLNLDEQCIEICKMVGDGKFWQKQITEFMRRAGLTTIRFYTKRNPDAWIRRYGGKVRGYYMEVMLDEIKV